MPFLAVLPKLAIVIDRQLFIASKDSEECLLAGGIIQYIARAMALSEK
jgi:hypothetical protein